MVTVGWTFELRGYRRAVVIAIVLAGGCDQGAKRSAAQTGSAGSAAIAQRRPQPSGSGAAVRPITACPVPDQRQIGEALRVQRGAVARCVEHAIAKTGASSVPARIDATFEVDERGSVVSASVASTGRTVDHELATCLSDVLLALRVAARNCPGSVTIRYPLFLEPAGE